MQQDTKGSFRSHFNYLTAFATIIDQATNPPHGRLMVSLERVYEALAVEVSASRAYSAVRTRPADRLAIAESNLKNAWTTELLLNLTGQTVDGEIMGMANNWGVVQAYYACYHAFQALHIVNGQDPLDSHEKARSAFTDFWGNRNHIFPPWSFVWGHDGPRNASPSFDFSDLPHQWRTCDASNCWGIAGVALKSTRDNWVEAAENRHRESRLKQKVQVWRKMNLTRSARGLAPAREPQRAQLTSAERNDIFQRIRPASLLDYLYRLRARCNYQDATMFTEGFEDKTQPEMVHWMLRRIVGSTLLLHELYVSKLVGRAALVQLIDDWANAGVVRLDGYGVLARRRLL